MTADGRWQMADCRRVLAPLALVCALLLAATIVLAEGNPQSRPPQPAPLLGETKNPKSEIGNYCLECHVSPPAQPLSALRPMEWARDVPCDTLRKAYEEVYQVDTLAAAAQNSAQQLRDQGFDASTQLKRLDARRVTADRLYQGDIVALSAFSNQGKAVRYQMNKVYAALQETRAERQRLIVLGWVLAASLFVLSSLFLGWRHTLKGQGKAKHSRMSLVWMVLACLVVFVLFATPLFGVAPPTPETTEEETERQNAVDQVSRVSDAAGRLSAQVWAIGNVGARWSALDQTQGSAALAMAIQSARDKETNLAAYWGQTQAVRESATSWRESTQDLALYRTDRLEAAASQSWHLRALAAGWIDVDKARSAELLDAALAANRQSPIAVYRDLELRAIAVTYARLDPARAGALLDQVSDPFLRAWGLREMGAYGQATEAARQVQDPYKRAWALRKIAEALPAANAAPILTKSLDAAARIEDRETQAYALADIALAWASKDANKGMEVVNRIDVAYPEARVMALHGLAVAAKSTDAFQKALAEAAKADDAYTAHKFVAAIAADYARLDAAAALNVAARIPDAFFRDQAYRDVAILTKRADVAARIGSPALRVQALIAVGDYQTAVALADKVEDTGVLRDLALVWAQTDPQAALVVVDKIEDSADKAAALTAIALRGKDPAVFERALTVAKSVRVRGESFAAARALSDLAAAYAAVDADKANQAFALALDVAKKVNVKY